MLERDSLLFKSKIIMCYEYGSDCEHNFALFWYELGWCEINEGIELLRHHMNSEPLEAIGHLIVIIVIYRIVLQGLETCILTHSPYASAFGLIKAIQPSTLLAFVRTC